MLVHLITSDKWLWCVTVKNRAHNCKHIKQFFHHDTFYFQSPTEIKEKCFFGLDINYERTLADQSERSRGEGASHDKFDITWSSVNLLALSIRSEKCIFCVSTWSFGLDFPSKNKLTPHMKNYFWQVLRSVVSQTISIRSD